MRRRSRDLSTTREYLPTPVPRRPPYRTLPRVTKKPSESQPLLSLRLFYESCQLRNDFQRIADDTVVCQLKNRSILILVDRDDISGRRHPGDMLHGPRN